MNVDLPGVGDWFPGALTFPCWVEPKANGFRLAARRAGGAWRFWSRGGNELRLPELAVELGALPTSVVELDGELMGLSYPAAAAGLDTVQARYLPFDPAGEGAHDRRRRRLEAEVRDGRRVRVLSRLGRLVRDEAEAEMAYRSFLAAGWEGMVLKDPAAAYGQGWFRRKPKLTVDAPIVALVPGEGRRAGLLAAVLVDVEGVTVRLGMGLSERVRAELAAAGAGAIGLLVEFEAAMRLPSGQFQFAVFKRLRGDKMAVGS